MHRHRAYLKAIGFLGALLVGILVLFHDAFLVAGIESVARSAGYPLRMASFHLGFGEVLAKDLRVTNRSGEPLFRAERIGVEFSLRDLFPGSRRGFGLRALDLTRPELTLIHRPDGSYNVGGFRISPNAKPDRTPLDVRVRLRDGTVLLVDRYIQPGRESLERIDGIAVDALWSPMKHSYYAARLDLNDGGRRYPVQGQAVFSSARGFESQRWRAAALPIGALVNFALNSRSFKVLAGRLIAVDARIYAIVERQGASHGLLSVSARLEGGKLAAAQLAEPIRDVRGTLHGFATGIATTGLDATLGGVPFHVIGGVYLGASGPSVRSFLRGKGEIARLRHVSVAAQRQPLSGPVAFSLFVEGPLPQPLTLLRFSSPKMRYADLIVTRPRGDLAISGTELDILVSRAQYGPWEGSLRGSLDLQRHVGILLAGQARAKADAIPYLAQVVPGQELDATALVRGRDTQLATTGVLLGAGGGGRLRAMFGMDQRGMGFVGPLLIERRAGGAVAAAALIDRPDDVLAASLDAFGVRMPAMRGSIEAHGTLDAHLTTLARGALGGRLRGSLIGFAHLTDARLRDAHLPGAWLRAGSISAIGQVRGTLGAPAGSLDILLTQGMYHGQAAKGGSLPVQGRASLTYAGDRIELGRASLLVGENIGAGGGKVAYARASGSVWGVRRDHAAPRFDVRAHVRAVDAALLVQQSGIAFDYPTEGSLDADVRVRAGAGAALIGGVVRMPEGAVNGLRFHDADALISGRPDALRAQAGHVSVGSTDIAFDGAIGARAQSGSARAAQIDLDDFDDFFDTGDMFDGRGWFAITASRAGRTLGLDADAVVTGTRFRSFSVGTVTVHAHPGPGGVRATLDVAGAHGIMHAAGRFALPPGDDIDAAAAMSGLDLATWLPAAGITVPLLGSVDGSAHARGRFKTLRVALHGALRHGLAGRIPIESLAVDADADSKHVHLSRVALGMPFLSVLGSGNLGMNPSDPFAVSLHAHSSNIGALATEISGRKNDAGGSLDADADVSGTQSQPTAHAQATLLAGRMGTLMIPRTFAALRMEQVTATLERGEVDFSQGTLKFAGHLPIALSAPRFIGARDPVAASFEAQGIDLAQFAPALPKGTKVGGVLNGRITVGGTLGQPDLLGNLALHDGSYVSPPLLTSPITHAAFALDFSGTQARMTAGHFEAGGGSVDASGAASISDLAHVDRSFRLQASALARHLRINVPKYLHGTIDGTLAVARMPSMVPQVSGTLELNAARIPLGALLPAPPAVQASSQPFAVGFDLGLRANRDVRVQGANVDIGARGRVVLGGTLASPTLDGRFFSTGGSLSFYRTFAVQSAEVAFAPDLGVIPNVDATATTHVTNPDTDILLHATGPATGLTLDFASDPSYNREEIVALLANLQQLGVGNLPTSNSQGYQPSLIQSTAEGYVNQQFTRTLLEPLQSQVAQALGLQNVQIEAGLGGNVGTSATAKLGKHLTGSFAQTYGTTWRRTVGLTAHLNDAASLQFSLFSANGTPPLTIASGVFIDPTKPNDLSLLSLVPPAGSSGFTLTYQHRLR